MRSTSRRPHTCWRGVVLSSSDLRCLAIFQGVVQGEQQMLDRAQGAIDKVLDSAKLEIRRQREARNEKERDLIDSWLTDAEANMYRCVRACPAPVGVSPRPANSRCLHSRSVPHNARLDAKWSAKRSWTATATAKTRCSVLSLLKRSTSVLGNKLLCVCCGVVSHAWNMPCGRRCDDVRGWWCCTGYREAVGGHGRQKRSPLSRQQNEHSAVRALVHQVASPLDDIGARFVKF